MGGRKMMDKKCIAPEDIKANIYDYVELIVDFHGITRRDIENGQEKLKDLLSADEYSMAEDSFASDEINFYGDRKGLSAAARKRYYDSEPVIRYYSKDETECVSLSRLFISISLSYETAHNLKQNMELLDKIICIFAEQEYFEVERVTLVKKDSIYCSSLDAVYQCFERSLFGDAGYCMKCEIGEKIQTDIVDVRNYFSYDEFDIDLNKTVKKGNTAEEKEIYEAVLTTLVAYDATDKEVSVKSILNQLNEISFRIFLYHITDSFLQDLREGTSKKVEWGFNHYE